MHLASKILKFHHNISYGKLKMMGCHSSKHFQSSNTLCHFDMAQCVTDGKMEL